MSSPSLFPYSSKRCFLSSETSNSPSFHPCFLFLLNNLSALFFSSIFFRFLPPKNPPSRRSSSSSFFYVLGSPSGVEFFLLFAHTRPKLFKNFVSKTIFFLLGFLFILQWLVDVFFCFRCVIWEGRHAYWVDFVDGGGHGESRFFWRWGNVGGRRGWGVWLQGWGIEGVDVDDWS